MSRQPPEPLAPPRTTSVAGLRPPPRTILRFVLAGLANTAFGLLVYSLAVVAGLPVLLALLLGSLLSLGFNFLTLGGYAFRDLSRQRMPRFGLAYCGLVTINWLLIRGLMDVTGLNAIAAQCVLVVPIALASYFVMARWVFTRGDPPA
jgi:putative flippase GtrA